VSLRRLSQLQWFGLLAGAATWAVEFLAGIGASQARCNPGSGRWNLPHDAIELGLMLFAAVVVTASLAASTVVFRATREVEEQAEPPHGRIHFFSAAAIAGNLVFLVIILLTGVDQTCHQA
jgi:hypothetical protein